MQRAVFDLPTDVHTHRLGNSDAIYNASPKEALELCHMKHNPQPYSLSLHPWDLRLENGRLAHVQEFVNAVTSCRHDFQLIAIGECGLDPKCMLSTGDQQTVFEDILDVARSANRPVIVHCVKLWGAMMESVARVWGTRQAAKAWDNGSPIIIHGFRKGPELVRQLVRKGYWISFGEHFCAESLREVPAQIRFMETDDSNLTIEEIKAIQDRCISMN